MKTIRIPFYGSVMDLEVDDSTTPPTWVPPWEGTSFKRLVIQELAFHCGGLIVEDRIYDANGKEIFT